MSNDEHPLRHFTVAGYLVALLFLVHPFVDVVTNSWPLNPASMEWRFGFFGVAANYLISPMFGLGVAGLVSALNGHRHGLLANALIGALAALFLLVGSMLYALDVLQLQNNVRPEAEFAFRVGSMKSFFKLVTSAFVFGVLAWATFRSARGGARSGPATPAVLVR